VLEEALAAARAADDEVADARRRFKAVADALVDVGAVPAARARHIVDELDAALAVRGALPLRFFTWRDPPPLPTVDAPVRQRGDGWLESVIEQHLDLVVDVPPTPAIASRVVDNLAPQVRALRAVGSLRNARRLDDLSSTLAAAGYGLTGERHGEVDKGWLSFLAAKPRPLTEADQPTSERRMARILGQVRGAPVTLLRVAWSVDVLQVEVDAPNGAIPGRWRASAFDDSGQLHLGQPGVVQADGRTQFRLRPGLRDTVRTLSLRVTHEATRLDEQVSVLV
jgi:hypothetical protein